MSPPDDFSFDTREFKACFDEVIKSGKRTAAQIVNRAGLLTTVGGKGVKGAMQLTPKANRAAIAGLDEKKIRGYVAAKLRKKGVKLGRGAGPSKGGRNARGQFTKGAGGQGVSTAQFNAMVKFERNRRIRGIGYTAGPGWDPAARAFGGRGIRKQAGFSRSKAAAGSGSKATIGHLTALLENAAPAADLIGREALQAALNNASRDMVSFHRRKMGETFKKYSVK